MLVSQKIFIIKYFNKKTCQMKEEKIVEDYLKCFSKFFPLLIEHVTQYDSLWS
jgi:hypothetical protein